MGQEQLIRLVEIDEEYHEIFHGDVKIGDANLYIYPESITIDNIEFAQEHQSKGYGRMVVEHLKKTPGVSCLTGDSVPEALPFWAKMGAVFDWGELERLEDTGHALVGFEISWRNEQD